MEVCLVYSSFHSSIGIILMCLPLPPVITLPAAFMSHHVVDRFGETYQINDVRNEGILHAADLAVGLLTGNTFEVIAGAVAANGMDLIDKAIAPKLGIDANTVFECHRQSGFSGAVPINEKDTIRLDVVGTGFALMTLLGH